MDLLLKGVLIGLAGTVAMDVLDIILNRLIARRRPDWGLVGRWVGHMPKIFHDGIAKAAPVRGEAALGWSFHYGIGVFYGVVFAVLAGSDWFADPSFLPIWLFGLLTISAGWFLLFPGMGLGWAMAKVGHPWRERAWGLLGHTVFATGMWACANLIGGSAGLAS
ncbi:hypothetical protein AX760_21740 [Pararhizobium antarcticum]|uniref:DUF2938 domain-containing protein n=1 Tax=Pararhizobium antarcticum TaxID=1798805 RepID=A0A657LPI8_9HYPH|nr:hypothetical protein AX760_21740 [Pararhizobium antarcticum]OJF98220.1 hypothetical protein AX761_12420 [Rhizobium sp. 58]